MAKKDYYGKTKNMENDLTSANDCTGIIPAGIEDEAQAEAYEDMYPIHKQKTQKKK